MLTFLYPLIGIEKKPKGPVNCLQCGECCKAFGGHLHASPRDLQRWREAGRQDLLDRVNRLGWIWVDPQTKQPVSPCPHIDRSDPEHVRCAIHEIKPDMCRDYPTLAHGKRCLRGVFLSMWMALYIEMLLKCAAVLETFALAA